MKTYLKALGLSFLLAGTEWADTIPSTNEDNISEKSATVYNTLPPTPEDSAIVYNTLPPVPEKSATVYNTLPPTPENSAIVYNTLPPVPDYGIKTKLNLQEVYIANNQHIRD